MITTIIVVGAFVGGWFAKKHYEVQKVKRGSK